MTARRVLAVVLLVQGLVGCHKAARLEAPAGFTLIKQGESKAIAVVAWDEEGGKLEKPVIAFKSSDPAVGAVDGAGNVTAVKTGDTSVTASVDGVIATVQVRVTLPASMECSPPTVDVAGAGGQVQLQANVLDEKGRVVKVPVTWSSGSPTVASVVAGPREVCTPMGGCVMPGEVTARGPGKTEVVGEATGLKCTVKITVAAAEPVTVPVEKELASIAVDKELLTLKLGAAPRKLRASGRDAQGREVDAKLTFTSTNPKVVSVDASGMVKPVGKGNAKVVVRSGGKSASVEVKVTK